MTTAQAEPETEVFEETTIATSVAFRPATSRHRVELLKDAAGNSVPCWTIVVTGRKVREWGFWCPRGFVPWHQFVDHTDTGNTGRGCE